MPQESVIDQIRLSWIFAAYLQLQNQTNPQEYQKEDINKVMAGFNLGFCDGFSAFIAHKFALGGNALRDAVKELNQLQELCSCVSFDPQKGYFFQDGGQLLKSTAKFAADTPEADKEKLSLTGKNNPMIRLLEDILNNMVWLQADPNFLAQVNPTLKSLLLWEKSAYTLSQENNKALDNILKQKTINFEKLEEWCQKLPFGAAVNSDTPLKSEDIKSIYEEYHKADGGKEAVLQWLDKHIFNEKAPKQAISPPQIVAHGDWDKLLAFTAAKDPELKYAYAQDFVIFRKEEIEKLITKIFSSLEKDSSKMIRIGSADHVILCYKQGDDYFLWNSNNGIFVELKAPVFKEVTDFVFTQLHSNRLGVHIYDSAQNTTPTVINPKEVEAALQEERTKLPQASLQEIDIIDTRGRTSLQWAARTNDLEVVNLLLAKGALINVKDKEGLSALQHAAFRGHTQMVALLLAKGAEIDARDPRTIEILGFISTKSGFEEITKLLRNAALLKAAGVGDLPVVKQLVAEGAELDTKTNYGATALHEAVAFGHLEVAGFLLSKKPAVDAKDGYGMTPLHWAAQKGHKVILKLLLSNKADVHAISDDKQTVLHLVAAQYTRFLAAPNDQPAVIALLLEHAKADIDAKDKNGMTALHLAVKRGNEVIVRALLNAHADPTIENAQGQTPFALANDAIKAILKAHVHSVAYHVSQITTEQLQAEEPPSSNPATVHAPVTFQASQLKNKLPQTTQADYSETWDRVKNEIVDMKVNPPELLNNIKAYIVAESQTPNTKAKMEQLRATIEASINSINETTIKENLEKLMKAIDSDLEKNKRRKSITF